jgi:hypothetical protein
VSGCAHAFLGLDAQGPLDLGEVCRAQYENEGEGANYVE